MFNLYKPMLSLIVASTLSMAQEASGDIIQQTLLSVLQLNNEKFFCPAKGSTAEAIHQEVESYLKMQGRQNFSMNDVAKTLYTLYPCPFSPYRSEVRLAKAKEIEGVWLSPETSQKLRFGPKSPMWSKLAASPIKCEAVAYYPEGEARNAQIMGNAQCPFHAAKDMDISRKNPMVVSWSMIENGKIKILRTDVPEHIEEWEIFIVEKPFEVANVTFKEGDLLAYLRRERGNDFNAATIFRHLQKLP